MWAAVAQRLASSKSHATLRLPAVSTDSVTPQNGSGGSQVFTFVFSDSNGYQDLLNRGGHILINTSPFRHQQLLGLVRFERGEVSRG